jgi:hypothetical protein
MILTARIWIFAMLMVSLCGCSANWHLKKAIAKNPLILIEGVVIERVTDTVTVITPEIKVDTVHAWSVDTVTTYVDRVRIRTKVDTVARTVYVDVICPADTIYVPYTYEKTTVRPVVKKDIPAWWIVVFLLVMVLLSLLRYR